MSLQPVAIEVHRGLGSAVDFVFLDDLDEATPGSVLNILQLVFGV